MHKREGVCVLKGCVLSPATQKLVWLFSLTPTLVLSLVALQRSPVEFVAIERSSTQTSEVY